MMISKKCDFCLFVEKKPLSFYFTIDAAKQDSIEFIEKGLDVVIEARCGSAPTLTWSYDKEAKGWVGPQ